MQGFVSLWNTLDRRARLMIGMATFVAFSAVAGLSLLGGGDRTALLYAGLDGTASGEVIAALEQQGATYEVRGDSIFVDAARRDQLRMILAGEGVPRMGAQGYELLDKLSGFGTTAQMFDAAYWRAKEGELARTILANPQIRAARVHISVPSSRPFGVSQTPSAAVTVTTVSGGLSTKQSRALRYLVAAAVAGLVPADVAVIDDAGGLIANGNDENQIGNPDPRESAIKARVERLLEARVGHGNAVVEVSVEAVTDRESITERRFDPESRVAISTENEEKSRSEDGPVGGQVTVASNLPEGDAASGANRSSKTSESRARTNFEVSETKREILRQPGAIKRLTVAVLVNATAEADGAAPRSDEELSALHDLVASAVGYDAERGDLITLKSLPFEPLVAEGSPPGPLSRGAPLDVTQLVKLAIISGVVLILGLFVVRPILAARPVALDNSGPVFDGAAEESAAPMALPNDDDMPDFAAIAPPIDFGGFDTASADEMGSFGNDDDAVSRLRGMIGDRQEETLQLLETWVDASDEAEPA